MFQMYTAMVNPSVDSAFLRSEYRKNKDSFMCEFGAEFSLEHAWGATKYIDEIVESGAHICYGPIATYRASGERRRVDIEGDRKSSVIAELFAVQPLFYSSISMNTSFPNIQIGNSWGK